MPKIIENLREQILRYGKERLIQNGYAALTMRGVASDCGIAIGTMYNYFDSKDILVAGIMMQDWSLELSRAEAAILSAGNCREGLQALHAAIRRFADTYHAVWQQFGTAVVPPEYHERLIVRLCQLISPLITRFCPDTQPDPTRFLAECILMAGSRSTYDFSELWPFIQKLM